MKIYEDILSMTSFFINSVMEVFIMKDYEIKYLKKKLLMENERQNEALLLHKELGFQGSLRDSTSELSSYDNHPADMGSETFELDKQFALDKHLTKQIIDVKDTLNKLDKGDYGTCEFCGKEIGFERLDIVPTAKLCIKCEKERTVQMKELEHDYPVEQDLLKTPFARTFTEGDTTAYDGEDAWQDVQRYGSSSGPQDISVNNLIDYQHTWNDSYEDRGYVEEVENISNKTYKQQLPDSHGDSFDGYVDTDTEIKVDYFGEEEPKK